MELLSPEAVEKLGIIGVLVVSGGASIRWLLRDRKSLVTALEEAHSRERDLRDQRAAELLQNAKQLAASSDVVRDALAGVERALDDLADVIQRELQRRADRAGD